MLCLALVADGAGFLFAGQNIELGAGLGHTVQAEHLHGRRWAGLLDALALVVHQRANFAKVVAADHDVADLQRALTDEQRGGWAAGFHAGFNDISDCLAVGVGLQFEHFGLEQDHAEQLVDISGFQRGDIDKNGFAAPLLADDAFFL